MKKVSVFLFAISIGSCGMFNPYSAVITVEEITLIANDSVGSEWSSLATVGGVALEIGESIIVDLQPGVLLKATAIEQDTYPDVGQTENVINSYDLISAGEDLVSYRVRLDVVVTEDRGAYAGNTALWWFVFLIEPE